MTDRRERVQRQQECAFVLRRAKANPGPVLELFASAGELTRALSEEGLEVLGVEPQQPPPSRVAELAPHTPATIVRAEPRALSLGRQFALVLALGSAVRRSARGEELSQLLASAARHLGPQGELILEMNGLGARAHAREHALQHLGTGVVASGRAKPAPDRMPFAPHLSRRGAGREAISRLALPALAPSELFGRLAASGLAVRAVYGDYDERPFDADAPRLVCIAGHAP